jgi:hypothetical protein
LLTAYCVIFPSLQVIHCVIFPSLQVIHLLGLLCLVAAAVSVGLLFGCFPGECTMLYSSSQAANNIRVCIWRWSWSPVAVFRF